MYDHKEIEKKWQDIWEKEGFNNAEDKSEKPKYYCLIEFPYPSGNGLHVGHIRSNTAMDIIARKRRAEGFNVLYPIGWDAFGLPTENYAIKTKTPPQIVTKNNTDIFRRQLKSVGFSFDWSREIDTTDPKYYKWTQWIFLQMFKHGLAYKKRTPINWCLDCKIGLANEEVVGGLCDRCGNPTEKREKEQWMLAITKYAERLHNDLDSVNYLEKIKIQQRNWIGKSEGAEIEFSVDGSDNKITVFTTRPDTLFGATFLAVSAEFAQKWFDQGLMVGDNIHQYIKKTISENASRSFEEKEKNGIFSGRYSINPANKEKIPVWIVNYVIGDVGTGAIMAVPAHDERDFDFAKKYNLPVVMVVCPNYPEKSCPVLDAAYTGNGYLVMSGEFIGIKNEEAKEKITNFVGGHLTTKYKLRDWVFSRQRYWGEPIPIVICDTCGFVPVPENELPLELPQIEAYTPTDTGESPLAKIDSWVNVKCPKCGENAKRETDTMPNWAGSSWYFLRYVDPRNNEVLADKKKIDYFMPVDWYNGGMEHTTLHLLYSRFWHKFLFDIGVVSCSEPYAKRTSHGMILAENGEKMSKSRGNVINPDDIVNTYGADTLRLYEMFMGPFEQSVGWNTEGIIGPRRFLDRIWKLKEKINKDISNTDIEIAVERTIKKVSEDIETMGFNTAISSMMILLNDMEKAPAISLESYKIFLKILAPFAPHITEELWHKMGNTDSIQLEPWPKFDETKIVNNEITIVIQVNGKVRDTILVTNDADKEEIEKVALARPIVQKWLENKAIQKIITVPGKLLNIVIGG